MAKEYRNAWKDADSKANTSSGDARANLTLQDLQLEYMLRNIIGGCDLAHEAVQQHAGSTANGRALTSQDFEPKTTYGYTSMEIEDTPFEYMDDAMDLD
jgi:hypothetical protein